MSSLNIDRIEEIEDIINLGQPSNMVLENKEKVSKILIGSLYLNGLENKEQKEKLNLIVFYLNKNKEFFTDFIENNKELLNGQYIEEKLYNYEDDFFYTLEPALKDSYLNYEKVVDQRYNLLYNEGLFRTKNQKIKHFEILDIYNDFGKSILIANIVLEILIKDIKKSNVDFPVSINIEVSDLMNTEFINVFKSIIEKYDLKLNDGMIIFEILENQELHLNNEVFNSRLKELEKIGIHFALDDIMKKNTHLETNENIIKALDVHKSLKIVKIFGKYLQELHLSHKAGLTSDDELLKIKDFLLDISNKGFKIVGEWIETLELFFFAKDKLGIEYFQGYLFDEKKDYILEQITN